MKIPEFVKISNNRDLRFLDIWRIYDHQFEVLREFLMTLGDKYEVEEFTGSTSKVLSLSNTYSSGQLFLYINGVIQWKDTDYIETSSRSVTLMYSRKVTDVIKVVIVRSNILRENIESYVEEIKRLCDGSKEGLEKAQRLISAIELMETELDQKVQEFEKQKHDLSDYLSNFSKDFDEKYGVFVEAVDRMEEASKEVSDNTESVRSMHSDVLSAYESVTSDSESVRTLAGEVSSAKELVDANTLMVKDIAESMSSAGDEVAKDLEEVRTLSDAVRNSSSNVLEAEKSVSSNADMVQTLYGSVSSARDEVSDNLTISESYLREIRSIREEIESINGLTPEELVDNEVILARGGAVTLGTRLDDMVYKFESIYDLQTCTFLKSGDVCIVVNDAGTSLILLMVKTPEDGESFDGMSGYYKVSDTGNYAHVVFDVGKRISDLEKGITNGSTDSGASGGSGGAVEVDLTDVYNRIMEVDNRVTAVSNRLSDVDRSVSDAGNQITELSDGLSGIESRVTVVEGKVTVLENQSDLTISVDGENIIINSGSSS